MSILTTRSNHKSKHKNYKLSKQSKCYKWFNLFLKDIELYNRKYFRGDKMPNGMKPSKYLNPNFKLSLFDNPSQNRPNVWKQN